MHLEKRNYPATCLLLILTTSCGSSESSKKNQQSDGGDPPAAKDSATAKRSNPTKTDSTPSSSRDTNATSDSGKVSIWGPLLTAGSLENSALSLITEADGTKSLAIDFSKAFAFKDVLDFPKSPTGDCKPFKNYPALFSFLSGPAPTYKLAKAPFPLGTHVAFGVCMHSESDPYMMNSQGRDHTTALSANFVFDEPPKDSAGAKRQGILFIYSHNSLADHTAILTQIPTGSGKIGKYDCAYAVENAYLKLLIAKNGSVRACKSDIFDDNSGMYSLFADNIIEFEWLDGKKVKRKLKPVTYPNP